MEQNNQPTKKYPATTEDVAKILGLKPSTASIPMSSIDNISASDLPVANLPVEARAVEPVILKHSDEKKSTASHEADTKVASAEVVNSQEFLDSFKNQPAYLKFAKAIVPYLGIFTVGLFLYYFFFSTVNFNSLFKSASQTVAVKSSSVVSAPETALQTLEKQNLASYNAWISGFYYDVSDPKITAPESDNSGNGLTNFQKYLLNLNPKSYDTLGLGLADSQAIASGINPLTGTPLSDSQKAVISKYFDMEVVMNRLTLANLNKPGEVAGASIGTNNDNSGLRGPLKTQPGTTVNNPQVKGIATSGFVPPQTGSDYASMVDQSVNINYAVQGRLDVPSLNISVPIVWSKDTSSFEQDLETGVIHYPGTAIPGQIGTTYIAGHSSNYFWDKGKYNHIFTQLGDLKDDASFSITVTDVNGKTLTYHYVVVSRNEFLPTDPAQIANTGKSLVALSTCWPVNTTAKRLVVYGQLTQVDN